MNCPRCDKPQHWTCSNPDCVCAKSVPPGELPQVNLENDAVACPYCGFAAHMDFWEEREAQWAEQESKPAEMGELPKEAA